MVIAMMGINDGMGDEPGLYQDDEQSGGLERFLGNLRTGKMARYIWENGLLTLREKGILGQPPPAEEGVTAAKNFNAGDDDYDYDAEANLQNKLKNNPRDAGVYIELGQSISTATGTKKLWKCLIRPLPSIPKMVRRISDWQDII